MENVTAYIRSIDDQSGSDIKDEKAPKTAERKLSAHDLPRFNFISDLPTYKKKVVSSNRDADNAAKPKLKPRSRLGAAKTDVPDIPRYSLPSGKLITRKERRSISYDESLRSIRELYLINRPNAVKTGGQPSDDDPSSKVESDWDRKIVIDKDLKARRMKTNNWVIGKEIVSPLLSSSVSVKYASNTNTNL